MFFIRYVYACYRSGAGTAQIQPPPTQSGLRIVVAF
jgi:hypothetical protein